MIAHLIAEFAEKFAAEKCMVATTWWRDVEFIPVSYDEPGLIPWATELPKEVTEQSLKGIQLKWQMDVDEMFYVGDVSLAVPGLLNTPLFQDLGNKRVLLQPMTFGRKAIAGTIAGNEQPCKWLELTGVERFAYDPSRLLFKLAWPELTTVKGVQTYVGGIVPLALKKEMVDA